MMETLNRVSLSTHLGLINLGCGIVILMGGVDRFPPPTYKAMVDFSGGHVWVYGVGFLVAGTVLMFRQRTALILGNLLGLICMNVLAALFLVSLVDSPKSGSLEWWIFFGVGTIHGMLLATSLFKEGP